MAEKLQQRKRGGKRCGSVPWKERGCDAQKFAIKPDLFMNRAGRGEGGGEGRGVGEGGMTGVNSRQITDLALIADNMHQIRDPTRG
jgi:hypothetical protein